MLCINHKKGKSSEQSGVPGGGYFECVLDEIGRIVLPFKDWRISVVGDAAYRVYDRETERYGLYSSSGEVILPIEFDYIDDMGDTLDYTAVRKNGEWYYVNSRNERVLL